LARWAAGLVGLPTCPARIEKCWGGKYADMAVAEGLRLLPSVALTQRRFEFGMLEVRESSRVNWEG
jgi:hypothetical protein